MKRSQFALGAGAAVTGATLLGARKPEAAPTPIPSPDPYAEKLLAQARDWWRKRNDVPYLTYGALIRYRHGKLMFDNWWDAAFRTKDGALKLKHIAIPEDDARRLRGFPITIFGFAIGDTNPEADPIRVEDPYIEPTSNFGLLNRYLSRVVVNSEATPNPLLEPEPAPSGALREIGRTQVVNRDYDVRFVGEEKLRYGDALHLKFTPLRDPHVYRIRDLWMHKETSATMVMALDGIYNGKPYDGARWTVGYVPLGGQWYLQQVRAENLRFGFNVNIEAMEIDFVDYRFPADLPKYTFDTLLK